MHAVLKVIEILPHGLRWFAARPRRVDRSVDQLHRRNVTRTIWKDRSRGYTDDKLRADGPREERIFATDRCRSIDAQALRFSMHGDEQHSDFRIYQNIAQAFKHAVAVVVGEG